MGFIDNRQNPLAENPYAGQTEDILTRMTTPGVWGSFQASFQNNGSVQLVTGNRSLANRAKDAVGMKVEREAGWEPLNAMKQLGPEYERYYDMFMNTSNAADFEMLKKDLDKRAEIDRTLSSVGRSGVGEFAGGLADPANLIPVGAIGKGLGEVNKLGKMARGVVTRDIMNKTAFSNSIRQERLLDRIAKAESNLDPTARNPLSTATGKYQFTKRTWLDTVQRYAPEQVAGKTEDEILAMRTDPRFSRGMARNLMNEQSEQLKNAGVPVNEATLSLAWFAGPKRAIEALKANPNTLVRDIFTPEEIKANPTVLAPGKKIGDVVKWAGSRLGDDFMRDVAASTVVGASVEVAGQFLSNPDYNASDAASTFMMAGALGLGGGAMAKSVAAMQTKGILREVQLVQDSMRGNLRYREKNGPNQDFEQFNAMMSSSALRPEVGFETRLEDVPFDTVTGKSVGAAAYRAGSPIDVFDKYGVGRMIRRMNPITDTLHSPSRKAKQVITGLYDTNLLTSQEIKDFEPVAPGGSVNTRVRMKMGRVAEMEDEFHNVYKEYQRAMISQGSSYVTKDEFSQMAFSQAFDSHKTFGTNTTPFLDRALNAVKSKVFQPFEKEVVESGLAKSRGPDYVPIIYSRMAIKEDLDGFKAKVKQAAIEGLKRAEAAGKKVPFSWKDSKAIQKFADDYTKFWGRDGVGELDEATLYTTPTGRSKNRTSVPLDYGYLMPYMENDILTVAHRYTRSVAPDVELMKRYGSLDLAEEIKEVKQDFEALIMTAANAEEAAKLTKEMDRIIDNIEHSVKTLRNRDDYSLMTSQGLRSAIKGVNTWTFVTKMGMFPVNSIGELGMATLTHGFSKSYGALFQDAKNGFKGLKLARQDAKTLGIAVDMALSDRMMALFDLHAPGYKEGKIERTLESMSGFAAKAFGMPYINDAMRTSSTFWNSNRFGTEIPKIADWTADNYLKTDFASLGIGQDQARIFKVEMDKHGEWIDGYYAANLQKWDDQEAATAYGAALMKAVDNDFILPQAGDLPKFAQSPAGKLALFMRSFMLTSTHRILLAHAQRTSINPGHAKGLAGVLAAGLLSHLLYETAKGRDPGDDPMDLVYGALNRSGIGGIFMEANNMADRTLGVGLGPNDQFAGQGVAKAVGEAAVGAAGVNAFTAQDVAGLISEPSGNNVMNLMPLQNHVLLEFAKSGLGDR